MAQKNTNAADQHDVQPADTTKGLNYGHRTSAEILQFTGELMKLLNKRELGLEVYGQLLDILMDFLGIGAAAIRLKLAEDFPFFVARGFSDRFLEEDNFICLRDSTGNVERDGHGFARLTCFCGAVIAQETGIAGLPVNDSRIFCANGESELSPSGRNLNVKTPHIKCFMEGFTALCLTPVRTSDGVSGLLILADSKPIMLTRELESLLEILSFGMGATFDRLLPSSQPLPEKKSLNEGLFDLVFNAGPIGIALADTIDYRFVRINDRFREMLGFSSEEITEMTVLDVTHPEDIARELQIFEEALNNRAPFRLYEKRLLTRGNKTLWTRVTVCAFLGDSNRPLFAIGMVEDIQRQKDLEVEIEALKLEGQETRKISNSEIRALEEQIAARQKEKKTLEENVRTFKSRFNAIAEAYGDIVFFKNRDRQYTYVNSNMAKTFGIPKKDLIGKMADDIFSAESAEQIRQIDMRVLAGEAIEIDSTHWIHGSMVYFQETKLPLKDSGGKVTGIIGLVKNVTDRKKSQAFLPDRQLDYPSPAMRQTMEKAAFAAQTDSIVLLQGESGSGKDHVARWIHEHSKRSSGPFLGINCAALPHELAESELFGHEQGAFTGAKGRKRGLLELAEGGTLLLNEIGELSLGLQTKLLTFLDTRSFMRVGGEKSIKVNSRIMAATHRDLKEEVAHGRFERALFYRLNVFSIRIPALRERIDDMTVLVNEMINKLKQEIQLEDVPEILPETISKLTQYDWPGNVRELRNVLERGLMLSRGPIFTLPTPLADDHEVWSQKISFAQQEDLTEVIRKLRISFCNEALRRSSGNRTRAASMLGISRDAFYRYLKSEKAIERF